MTCSIRSLEERKRRDLRATGCMEGDVFAKKEDRYVAGVRYLRFLSIGC